MDNLYFDQGFEDRLYSDQEMREMYKEMVKTSLNFQSIWLLIAFFVLFLEGVIFIIIGVEGPMDTLILLLSFIPLIVWFFLKNKSNQIRNAVDNDEGFYAEIKTFRGIKVPTYTWVKFGRSTRLDIRMIQFKDGKVSLYTVYPKMKKIFELNSNDITFKLTTPKDITFKLTKDQKKIWIQTPSKRHAVYFMSKYEEKIKNYLIREGYKTQDK